MTKKNLIHFIADIYDQKRYSWLAIATNNRNINT